MDYGSESEMETEKGEVGGDVTKLAKQVGSGLSKFSEMVNASSAATDADKEKMAMVLNGFIELVEKNLGENGPGEDAAEEESPDSGIVSAAGGAKGVPMGPNTRM